MISSLDFSMETRPFQCEVHGEVEETRAVLKSGPKPWSGCRQCRDERQAEKERIEHEEAMRKADANRLERAVGYAAIPPRFADKSFDTFIPKTEKQRQYLDYCKNYVANFAQHFADGTGLLMMGAPGTGKTHLAIATLERVIREHRKRGLYTTAARMFRRIKSTYDRDSVETESQVVDIYSQIGLLVMDEIGLGFGSDTEMNLMFDILNYRYEQKLPTIIISNRQPNELSDWLGDRVVDRLRECCKAMAFDWQSERRELGRKLA